MKIVLIDGTYEGNKGKIGQKLLEVLTEKGHVVKHLELAKMNVAYCQGCWSCWVATPGRCVHKDDTEILLRETIQADLVIHTTENKFGTVTSLTKKAIDKSTPLHHPHILVKNGESAHKERYEKFPDFGVVVVDYTKNEECFSKIKKYTTRLLSPIFEVHVSDTNFDFNISDLVLKARLGGE